jgi:hypothetical protein
MNLNQVTQQNTRNGRESNGQWQLKTAGWSLFAMSCGGILIFVLSLMAGMIIRGYLNHSREGTFTIQGLAFFPVVVGLILAVVIGHEAIHGLLFLLLGGKPRFGFKMMGRVFPVAYTTSRVYVARNSYLLVALGPFLVLTAILAATGLAVSNDNLAFLALAAMALNISGSTADFGLAYQAARHQRTTLFRDTQDGFRWSMPAGGQSE